LASLQPPHRTWPVRWIRSSLLALLTAAMGAQAPKSAERPIRLALYSYGYFYDRGRGIDKDIVDELVRRSGRRFDVQVMARARIWADLEGGQLDMTVSGIQTPQRDRFAWFIPYLAMKNVALIHLHAAEGVKDAEAFLAKEDLQLGVVRSFKHGPGLDARVERLRAIGRVQESPDAETLFLKLRDHHIDALLSQPPVYLKYLQDLGMKGQVLIQDWAPREKGVPHGLVLAKHRFTLAEVAQWRALVQEMKLDGTLKAIYGRYLPASEVKKLMEF
jgi:polar amino acid transport system substrate-binding protein